MFSPRTIEALTLVISGGSGDGRSGPPIGVYRSGPKIESFMRSCNVSMRVEGSRVPDLSRAIEAEVRAGNHETLRAIAEGAADPRDFVDDPNLYRSVLDYLNRFLKFDGYELQAAGIGVRLVQAGASFSVVEALAQKAASLDFDTVRHDLDRALANAEVDPEDAVTAACSVLESVCRSILVELEVPLPDKKDIQGLYRAVREPLGLSPEKGTPSTDVADDVRQVLGGLNTAISGIGALRTHGGDAHGRERGRVRSVDPRIARLAIHASGALSLFLVETWQRKFPSKELRQH